MGVLRQAQGSWARFNARPEVEHRLLRISFREDLRRTMAGDGKEHEPDNRVMFGLSDSALHATHVDWGELAWILDDYRAMKKIVVGPVEEELRPLCGRRAPYKALSNKILQGREAW